MSDIPNRLELRNICRSFEGKDVVTDVSLTLQPGQVTCLLGPSGCGKSTTLKIVAGVDRQNSGEVLIDGAVVSNGHLHTPPEARNVGLMFQDFALFPHMTVAQNIGFGLNCKNKMKRGRIGGLLEKVGLSGFDAKYPHQLSGGEQQRVALARALAPKPQVMLMDEPFSGLDNRLRDEVREATLEILRAENAAVLMVTHEPEEAMRLSDQIALMRGGQIVQSGAPYNIYNAPIDRQAAAFFSDINVISGTVKNALIETPFGQFLTPAMVDGTQVEIVIRPQHLKLDFDRQGRGPNPTVSDGVPARGQVSHVRYLGHQSVVVFKMDYDGSSLKVVVPGVFMPKPDTPMWLSMRRDRCFLFQK